MRQTLFWIPDKLPDEWGGAPLFGLGLFLALWGVGSVLLMAWLVRRQGWNDETRSYVPILLVIGAGIAFVAPFIVEPGVGLPIRGYGVMVTLGVISGVCLSAWQARRMGLDPEIIYSLAGWMFLGGIGGARVFYVIQYWDQFYDPQSVWLTLRAVANITKGGLVVYGSVIGGVAALIAFCRLRKLPPLAIGDLIAPGMLVGLAFGRVGCLLNGCCYGGVCEDRSLPAIVFPRFADERAEKTSDPYAHQQSLGLLHGFRLGKRTGRVVVDYVRPDSPAARSGLMAGQVVTRIDLDPSAAVFAALTVAELAGGELEIEASSGEKFVVPITARSGEKASERSPNVVGFELLDIGEDKRPLVDSVFKGSLAERAGLKAGQRVESIRLPAVTSHLAARGILVHAGESVAIETEGGQRYNISLTALPHHSRPVHPTQIYSSIKAGLLAFFLWSYYPFRRRDGEVFALMLMIYPLFRILLEVIRDDVPGLFGTPITISQAVSGVILAAGLWLFVILLRRPRGSVLPPAETKPEINHGSHG